MNAKVTRAIKPEAAAAIAKIVEGAAPKAAPTFLVSVETKTYDLKFPLAYDGKEYRNLTLSRLKGRDFENFALLSQMGVPHSVIFMSMITGMPIEVVQELDADDWLELAELIKDFIPARFLQEAAMASGPDSQTGQDMQA